MNSSKLNEKHRMGTRVDSHPTITGNSLIYYYCQSFFSRVKKANDWLTK